MLASPFTRADVAVSLHLPDTVARLLELAVTADGAFESVDALFAELSVAMSQRVERLRRRDPTRAQLLEQVYVRLVAGAP